MLNITMVGNGALGRSILTEIAAEPFVKVGQLLTIPKDTDSVRQEFPQVVVADKLVDLPEKPELLLECAGHGAVLEHVLPALQQGISCIICSVGALAERELTEKLEGAARASGAQVQLISGAIGGIDAIAAGSIGGLSKVVYTGRKAAFGWKGTPAEDTLDLQNLAEATMFFEGSAREAAREFPKNANVAAAVSLAGIGLDETEVRLIADPAIHRNCHQVNAEGAFGELQVQLANLPLTANPKTSALTTYSAVRALRNHVSALAI